MYDGGPYSGPGFEWLPEAARRATVVFSANDSLPLRVAASADLGLAALPHFLGSEAPDLVPIDGASGTVDLYAVTRDELRRVPRVRAVMEFLDELVTAARRRLAGE